MLSSLIHMLIPNFMSRAWLVPCPGNEAADDEHGFLAAASCSIGFCILMIAPPRAQLDKVINAMTRISLKRPL